MPLYEYGCDKCQKTMEMIQKVTDAPLQTCPDCKGPVRRLISKTSFQLKGTGWYATDYKKSAASSANPPESASPAPEKKVNGDS